MNLTTQRPSYNAKQLNTSARKQLALSAIDKSQTTSGLAETHQVSRKFVSQQRDKAMNAVNDAFKPTPKNNEKVLFYLPVTFSWICQLILCLVLHCGGSYRGVKRLLKDTLDYDISLGTIHNIVDEAKYKAIEINSQQDLSKIKLAAQDEMFHYNKPILTGIDIPSLYCYLLKPTEKRDFDTWGTHLLDLKERGLNPERMFGDAASAIEEAHNYVYPHAPYHMDNFHMIRDMMEMRRFFRNRLKRSVTCRNLLQKKVDDNLLDKNNETYHEPLAKAIQEEKEMRYLSKTIDTLVSWMQHDVLNMPGLPPTQRYELFDFVLEELNKLAQRHPHRIKDVCTTLENQKNLLLSFTEVLDNKFQAIADEFVFPLEKIWEMCILHRCDYGSANYAIRSIPLQDYFGNEFEGVEDAVLQALDTTERTSSMVENLHSRVRPYFNLRREIGDNYTELLRFYINHTPFMRSAREARKNKTPTQILSGNAHPHWLEMLGYKRFKKAA